ncbi:RNA polymerase, sigma-24 subunit, ECF subfamily [Chthoniobacter flavus Ellin428]|uniref:RNA polymerase, sigma-24 subunit, ECF subfamily n=1 Tax=Chthoniobacter flavus Ellin428 TaxID=497964 RepID=B4DA42_9BACT|nr:sigma-70 family RNA polymerase sigma factor [Chthoniobacter flavus]EDY16669.1 RNA polymerase, sigma-24 subunit, ECF subfamily [Chthoniobacter flavus Ellin428]TCO87243.1 RNA polymerase sigma-70 factor (ECF subfamily) [Chthoniobacter flavus]
MPAPDALELIALLDRFERPLVRYAQSITGDLESARDVVQETFIKLARGGMSESGDVVDNARHLEAWLFTVTRNRAVDHQRKFSRIIPMPLPEDRPCAEPGPAAVLERQESATALFRLLDALSPNQREVIRLKFQNDLSYREIAEITRLSVTNVGFLLHSGLKKLRELLREQSPEDFDLSRSVL